MHRDSLRAPGAKIDHQLCAEENINATEFKHQREDGGGAAKTVNVMD